MHVATAGQILHLSWLYGKVVMGKPQLEKIPIKAERHVEDSRIKWKTILWSDKTKIKLFDHQTGVMFGGNQTAKSLHPHCEAWWWQHHAALEGL